MICNWCEHGQLLKLLQLKTIQYPFFSHRGLQQLALLYCLREQGKSVRDASPGQLGLVEESLARLKTNHHTVSSSLCIVHTPGVYISSQIIGFLF